MHLFLYFESPYLPTQSNVLLSDLLFLTLDVLLIHSHSSTPPTLAHKYESSYIQWTCANNNLAGLILQSENLAKTFNKNNDDFAAPLQSNTLIWDKSQAVFINSYWWEKGNHCWHQWRLNLLHRNPTTTTHKHTHTQEQDTKYKQTGMQLESEIREWNAETVGE